MNSQPKILIIGGGVAGLCFALQLARRGISTVIWEKLPAPIPQGHVIGLWKNGFDILEQLGVDAAVRNIGKTSAWSLLTDKKNRPIKYTDLAPLNEKYGGAVRFMTRGALHEILQTALGDAATIRFNTSIAALEELTNGVQVADSHGEEFEFDLVVGADGINSALRNLMFGDETIKHNAIFYYTSVSMSQWQSRPQGDIEMTDAGTFLGLYPLLEQQCGVYAAIYRRPGLLQQPPLDVLRHYFGDFGGYAPAMLNSCQEANIFGDIIREARPPKWHGKNCMLIGDAAHAMLPTTGQGVSLAMEDGFLLATLVADSSPQQWTQQFAAFTKSRQQRLGRIRRRAALINAVVNYTPAFLCPPRNALIRLLDGTKAKMLDNFLETDASQQH